MIKNWGSFTCVALAVCLLLSGAGAQADETAPKTLQRIVFYAPHWLTETYYIDTKAFVDTEPPLRKVLNAKSLTYNISYEDAAGLGFNDPVEGTKRRARLEEALEYVGNVINISGSLDVRVEPSKFENSGTLASAGTFYSTAPGFTNGTAFQRLTSGSKPFAGFPEIRVICNFGYNWNFDLTNPASNEFDFLSVLVHEITHGMGFASLAGNTGTSVISANVYSFVDSLMIRRTGDRSLFGGSPPAFLGSETDLRSNDLAFIGTTAFTRYAQGVDPGIYAPNPYSPGSSLSHWDTGNIVGGAVMEHAISPGVNRRQYSNLEIGALRDMGYTSAAQADAPGEGEGEGEGEINVSVSVTVRDADIAEPITNATLRLDPSSRTFTDNVSGKYSFTISDAGTYKVSATANGYSAAQTANFSVGAGSSAVSLSLEMNPFPSATATVSPNSTVNYGTVDVGESVEQNFRVTNTGGGKLVGGATVSGTGFSVLGKSTYSLGSGDQFTVSVRFSPSSAADFSGSITFTGGTGSIKVNLSGAGENTTVDPPDPPAPGGCGGCGTITGGGGASLGESALLMTIIVAGLLLVDWRRRTRPSETRLRVR